MSDKSVGCLVGVVLIAAAVLLWWKWGDDRKAECPAGRFTVETEKAADDALITVMRDAETGQEHVLVRSARSGAYTPVSARKIPPAEKEPAK